MTHKHHAMLKSKSNRLKATFYFSIFTIFLSGLVLILWTFYRPHHIAKLEKIIPFTVSVKQWFNKRPLSLNTESRKSKTKTVAVSPAAAEPDIHFEFYTALPNTPAMTSSDTNSMNTPIKNTRDSSVVSINELEKALALETKQFQNKIKG